MLRPPCSFAPPGCRGAPETPPDPPGKGGPRREAAMEWWGKKAGRNWQKDGVIRGMGMAEEAADRAAPPSQSSSLGAPKSVCVPPNPPRDPRAGLGSSQGRAQTPFRTPIPTPRHPKGARGGWGGRWRFLMPFSPNLAHSRLAGWGTPMQHRPQTRPGCAFHTPYPPKKNIK